MMMMTRITDWLWLALTWAGLLVVVVAGLLIAASEWKSRHDLG